MSSSRDGGIIGRWLAAGLSGRIDSCAVLGLAQQSTHRPIRAFTLTFENPLYDEASVAEAQARHVGASYHPIPIRPWIGCSNVQPINASRRKAVYNGSRA